MIWSRSFFFSPEIFSKIPKSSLVARRKHLVVKKEKKKSPNAKVIFTSTSIDNYLFLRVRGSWKLEKTFTHLAEFITVSTLIYANPYPWNWFLTCLLLPVLLPKKGIVETCCSTCTPSPEGTTSYCSSPATSLLAVGREQSLSCRENISYWRVNRAVLVL